MTLMAPLGSRGGKHKRNAAEIAQHQAAKLANMSDDARAEMQINKEPRINVGMFLCCVFVLSVPRIRQEFKEWTGQTEEL